MSINTAQLSRALEDLRSLLGIENVLTSDESFEIYGSSTFATKYTVLGAVLCSNKNIIPDIVAIANTYSVPLYPVSGGKNWGYGNALPPEDALVLDLTQLKTISNFDKELGVITLESGVTQQELYNFLLENKAPYLVPVHGGGPDCSIVGNALERGYGITPNIDHFSAVMSLEAVLASGEVYRSALHALGGNLSADSYKWGTGPYLDGLFTQGNFGIVTSITLALAPVPEKIHLVYFRVKKDKNLQEIIPALHKTLRLTMGSTGGFNLMNARRVLSMIEDYPKKHFKNNSLIQNKELQIMAAKEGIQAWTGIGAIYGDKAMVKAVKSIVRRELRPYTSGLLFVSPFLVSVGIKILNKFPFFLVKNFLTSLSSLANLFDILYGKPNEVALPLTYWKSGVEIPTNKSLNPSRDGCGVYWYSPILPFKESLILDYVQMVTTVCKKYRIEPLITLTTISERCFDSTIPILFNMKNEEESQRAKACYYELFEEGRKRGYVPYRYSISSLHLLEDTDSPTVHFARQLKQGVDPKNIIAPGRYVFQKR